MDNKELFEKAIEARDKAYAPYSKFRPMHAFDVRKIEGEKIIIETAKKGEKFVKIGRAHV